MDVGIVEEEAHDKSCKKVEINDTNKVGEDQDNDGDDDDVNSGEKQVAAVEKGAAANVVKQVREQTKPKSIGDFLMGMLLGEGAYARVHVCKLKTHDDLFAIKVMEKKFILKEGKINFVTMEKKVLSVVDHALVNRLYYSFHDAKYLYMVMDLCKGGELQKLIRVRLEENETKYGILNRSMNIEEARFYLSETVSALQYLHGIGFVHRDLKPDNILICSNGHIKLTDFGTVKDENNITLPPNPPAHGSNSQISDNNNISDSNKPRSSSASSNDSGGRRGTFCGTADYVSPEVLSDQESSVGVDIWALGCLLFEMLVGSPPFRGGSEYLTFQLIMNHGSQDPLSIPSVERLNDSHGEEEYKEEENTFADAEDLINKLIVVEPTKRLGVRNNYTSKHPYCDLNSENGPDALRNHQFFNGINFDTICEMFPPFKIKYHFDIPEPTIDGNSDEWTLAGDITELELAAALQVESISSGTQKIENDQIIIDDGSGSSSASHQQDPTLVSQKTTNSEIQQFLKPNEKILLDGLVVKRKRLVHVTTRHLVLTDLPRFFYIDPVKVVVKGEIPITKQVHIQVKNNKTFFIITPKRTYYMTDLMSQSQRWKDALDQIVIH